MVVHLISSSHLLSQNDHLSIHFLLPLKVLFRPVELSKSVTLHVAIVFCGLGCILIEIYKTFSVLIYSYINTSGNWKNENFEFFQFSRVLI